MSVNLKHIFQISLLLLFVAMNSAYAQAPSPAGGGMLWLNGERAYAIVPPNDVLLKDYHEGITIDGWLYLEEYPKKSEIWMLLHKPGAFQIVLLPSSPEPKAEGVGERSEHIFFRFSAAWKTPGGGHSPDIGMRFQVPLRQWLYFYGIIGKQRPEDTMLDGDPAKPLTIGRKLADNDLFAEDPWLLKLKYHAFHGAIDELRISNIVRGLVGEMQIYLGTCEDAPQNVPIPNGPFQPDEHTVALWHFEENERIIFSDASKNNLKMFAREGAFNPIIFPVTPKGKVTATWGRIKNQKRLSH
jgi:hypothetical protein